MFKKVFIFLPLAIVTFSITFANADSQLARFDYRIRIPQTQRSCVDEAVALGQRLATASGASVINASCERTIQFVANGQPYTLYSLDVNYESQFQLIPFTSDFGSDPMGQRPGPDKGAYGTYADCIFDIKNQSNLFTQITGLAPVAVSCESARTAQDYDSDFVMQIDSFGTSKISLNVFQLDFRGTKDSDLMHVALQMFSDAGASVAKISDSQLFYYSTSPIPISHESILGFGSKDECQSQIASANDIYQKAGNSAVNVICVTKNADNLLPDVFFTDQEVFHLGGAIVTSDYGSSSARYFTFQECIADRDRIVAGWPKDNQHLLGGLCLQNENGPGYLLNIFSD